MSISNISAASSAKGAPRVNTAVRTILQRHLLAALVIGSTASGAVLAEDTDDLSAVVVSATRRETTTQDVPYSISVVGASQLQNNNVTSIADLASVVPGVSFVNQGPLSLSNIVLRGINANSTAHASTSTIAPVSTYIGETPMLIPLQIDDLERVEVLRGPQGTLYGSGSLAGTIRFIPKEPELSGFSGNVGGDISQVEVGHDFNGKVNAAFNIPITSTLAARVSGAYEHWAGFINENYIAKLGPASTADKSPVGIPVSADGSTLGPMVFTPISNANTTNQSHVRAQLLFKPNEDFRALLTYYHQNDDGNGSQSQSPDFGGNVDTPPAKNPFYSASYPVSYPTGGVTFPQNRDYDANNSFLLRAHDQTDLVSLDASYQFGFASLSSDTSYYRTRTTSVNDGTGLLTKYPTFYGFIPRMVDYEPGSSSDNALIEELRLVSKPGKYFDYVVGAYFEHQIEQDLSQQYVPGQTYFGGLVGEPGANAEQYGDLNADSNRRTYFFDRALFGEFTGHLTDRWDATGGIRQFWQEYTLTGYGAFPYCGGPCDNGGGTYGSTVTDAGYAVKNHIFKLNTAYKFGPDLNGYITYSEGFRRGGSNAIPISGPFAASPALLIYKPDETKNYEIGAKGRAAGVNFSAAVFYIKWDNFQVDASAAAGGGSGAVNGAKADSKGVELELNGTLLPHLTYDLGYSYARAEVAENFNVYDTNQYKQLVAIVTGHKGDPLPNSPRNSFTGSVDYTPPAPALPDWDMHYHANWSYRSSTLSQLVSTDPQAAPPFEINGFWMMNIAVGMMRKGGFETALYCDNLFNTLGVTGGQDAGSVGPRAAHYFVARPRTIGLKASYEF